MLLWSLGDDKHDNDVNDDDDDDDDSDDDNNNDDGNYVFLGTNSNQSSRKIP